MNSGLKSQLVGEENPINGDREGFFRTCLNVDPDYLPALSSAFNKGALLGNRFVTIHVEIALFRGWIAVVPKHYLLGASHVSLSSDIDKQADGKLAQWRAASWRGGAI